MDCQLQGINLHYELAGQGQPVVLLHGWGCSTDTFRPVAEHLAAHFTVYNLDLPGFGPVSYTHLDVYKRQPMGCSPSSKCGS